MEQFGELETDKNLKKIITCREIVKSIMNYGVTQEQILLIIQFLGCELHDHEQMVEIVSMTKEFLKDKNALLIKEEV